MKENSGHWHVRTDKCAPATSNFEFHSFANISDINRTETSRKSLCKNAKRLMLNICLLCRKNRNVDTSTALNCNNESQ